MRGYSALIFGAVLCSPAVWTVQAHAQSLQTWVSPAGNDANDCTLATPCQTFQAAHDKTAAGGSIGVLASGDFGPVAITQPITIVADGVEALISSASGGAAVRVATQSIGVTLRGLTIDLATAGFVDGIMLISGSALNVDNVTIRNAGRGIFFTPGAQSLLNVTNSTISNAVSEGILVQPTSVSVVRVMLDRVHIVNSGAAGVTFSSSSMSGRLLASVRDTVSSGHSTGAGFRVIKNGGNGTANVMIDRSTAANNQTGIATSGSGTLVRVGDSTITGNGRGFNASSQSAIESYGSNQVNGNTIDGAPTRTIAYR